MIKETGLGRKQKLAAAVIFSLLSGTAFCQCSGISTSNDLQLWLFVLFVPLYIRALEIKDKKLDLAAGVCGLLFMLAYLAANLPVLLSLETADALYRTVCIVSGMYLFFKSMTAVLFKTVSGVCADISVERTKKECLKIFFISALCMAVCRIPYFLLMYPGGFNADSCMQFYQILGLAPYSNHHPFVHTMFVKATYSLGLLIFKSRVPAFAFSNVCQCVIMTFMFAYIIESLYKYGIKKKVIIAVLAYFCIMPYHGAFGFIMWKDSLFGAVAAVFAVTMWRFILAFKNKKAVVYESIMLYIYGTLFCLFRTNGYYAFLVFIPFFAAAFFKKSKTAVGAVVMAFLTAAFVKGPVYSAMGVVPVDFIEAVSVPVQQMACALKDNVPLTAEEYELLSEAVDVKTAVEYYNPNLSDDIKYFVRQKNNQNYIVQHKADYFKLWLKLGMRAPTSYIKAYSSLTCGFYYPNVDWAGYSVYGEPYYGEAEMIDMPRHALMPQFAADIMKKLLYSYTNIYFVGVFFNVALSVWLCILTAALCFIKKEKVYFIIYIPMLAYIATILVTTPVCVCFRYVYCIFTTLPLLCILPFLGKKDGE